MRTSTASLAVITTVTLAATPSVAGGAEPDTVTGTSTEARSAATTWHSVGRFASVNSRDIHTALSSSGVWAAAAMDSTDRAIVARRLPGGDLAKYRLKVSGIDSVDVDRDGDVTVVATRRKKVLALSWRLSAQRPTAEVLIDAKGTRGRGTSSELLTNGRGDAIVVGYDAKGLVLVRRASNGHSWQPPVRPRVPENSSDLTDLSMKADGRLLAAFVDDTTASLRKLNAADRSFGTSRKVLSWPATAGYGHASLANGPHRTVLVAIAREVPGDRSDDFAKPKTLISPCEDDRYDPYSGYKYRYVILSKRGPRFMATHRQSVGGLYDDAVIGLDGSVTIHSPWSTERWRPDTRRVRVLNSFQPVAVNPRGDVAVQHTNSDERRLSVWQLGRGKPWVTRAASLDGRICAADMSNSYRAYVLAQRDGKRPGYYLNIGRLR